MIIKSRTLPKFVSTPVLALPIVALSVVALSLLPFGCSRPPGKPLGEAPVIVSKQRYDKKRNTLEGTITNKSRKPLASVTITLRLYVGGDAYFGRKVIVQDLKPAEKRSFSQEDTSGLLKKPTLTVSQVIVREIETSEPARYSEQE